MKRSIIIVEDDLVLREKFECILNSEPDMHCVGGHVSVGNAMSQITRDKPDVLIVNIKYLNMPNITYLTSSNAFVTIGKTVLAMSSGNVGCIGKYLRAGIHGRQGESSFSEQLVQAIRSTERGAEPMRGFLVLELAHNSQTLEVLRQEDKDLSPRQHQIIQLLAMGFIYREIATKLNIGSETVRSHVKHIYKKLNVRNRTTAIAKYNKVCEFL